MTRRKQSRFSGKYWNGPVISAISALRRYARPHMSAVRAPDTAAARSLSYAMPLDIRYAPKLA